MTDPTRELADAVADFCERRFVEVHGILDLAVGPLSAAVPHRAELGIEDHVLRLLAASDPPLAGAGVVVAPHVLPEDPYWLEWWLAGPEGDPAAASRLAVDVNPDSVSFRDYSTLAWFEEPRRTGQRCITGPYVDYLCTDQYALTFTVPVVAGERFLGVAGVDVLVRWFEEYLLRHLDTHPELEEGCVVVNHNGRVVASPDDTWVTGDLIRELGPGGGPPEQWQVTPCGATPFVVARPADVIRPGRAAR